MTTDVKIAFIDGVFLLASVGVVWLVLYLAQTKPKERKPTPRPVDNEPRWVKRNGKWEIEQ